MICNHLIACLPTRTVCHNGILFLLSPSGGVLRTLLIHKTVFCVFGAQVIVSCTLCSSSTELWACSMRKSGRAALAIIRSTLTFLMPGTVSCITGASATLHVLMVTFGLLVVPISGSALACITSYLATPSSTAGRARMFT